MASSFAGPPSLGLYPALPPCTLRRRAKTPLANFVTGIVVMLTLLVLTPIFTHMSSNVQARAPLGAANGSASAVISPLRAALALSPSTPVLARQCPSVVKQHICWHAPACQ